MCPRRCVGTCRKIFELKKKEDKATFYSPSEEWILPAASAKKKKTEERELVVDSGACMHMVSKKDREDIEKSDNGSDSQLRSANIRKGNGRRPRIGFIRGGNASWKYTGSSFTWITLRRIWVQLPLDQWPETTSHQKWQVNSLRHIKSCTIRRSWFINEFLYLIYFFHIFIAGNCDWHGNSSNKKWKYERGIISTGRPVA